jgi:hypothetical protein
MTKGRNIRPLLALIGVLAGVHAGADDSGVSYTIHHQYVAPRALGMGDAFVAVANDYNALFYNPAGLARREDGELNLYIDAAGSAAFGTASKDFKDASDTQGTESEKLSAEVTAIEKYYGKAFSVRLAPANAILVRPHWGIGIIPADVSAEMTMHQNVGPAINLTVYADTTLAYGYGDDFHGMEAGRLSWGFTGKLVNRGYFSRTVTAIEVAANPSMISAQDLREGYTVDGDLGFLFTPHLPADGILSTLRLARPTFGAVIRNVGETGFKNTFKLINKEKTEEPEKLYRVLDVGTKWEYPSAWIFGGRGVLDIRDIGHPAWNWRKGTHAGFEFDWAVSSWWRGNYRFGLNQGYLSAGVSAMFTIFNIDVVTYSEDVGTFTQPVENRMYMVRLNLNF